MGVANNKVSVCDFEILTVLTQEPCEAREVISMRGKAPRQEARA